MKNIILNKSKIDKIVKRLAYQILESNLNSKEIVLIGVYQNGYFLAQRIFEELKNISKKKIDIFFIKINKKNPLENLIFECKKESLKNKSIVLIDDVLNTGSTLIHAVSYFLQIPVKRIKTAVMVNRNHKKFPIKADFKGLSLSTSVNEHITVHLRGNSSGIYLS